MTDIPSNGVHQQAALTDLERAVLVTDDLNGKKTLSEYDYEVLLMEIKHRQARSVSSHRLESIEEAAPEVGEVVEWSMLEADLAGSQIEHGAKSAETSLGLLGPIGFFIANGIGLLLTPWRCFKEKRWPTRDEWIKLALCVATIAFVAVAVAIPVLGFGFMIAAAAIGVIKGVQTIQMKKDELHCCEQLAKSGHDTIQQLIGEIDGLATKDNLTDTQNTELDAKRVELKEATDRYVRDGHDIHRLNEEVRHPFKSLPSKINVAMSALALVGVALAVAAPPVSLALLTGAGVVSLVTLGVTAASKWLANRHKSHSVAPVSGHPAVQPHSNNEDHPDNAEDKLKDTNAAHLSSTAQELSELTQPQPASLVVDNNIPPISPHEPIATAARWRESQPEVVAVPPNTLPPEPVSPLSLAHIETEDYEFKAALKKMESNVEVPNDCEKDPDESEEVMKR